VSFIINVCFLEINIALVKCDDSDTDSDDVNINLFKMSVYLVPMG